MHQETPAANMSKLAFDILLYIPMVFITTILVGLKLDHSGTPANASWALIVSPLVIYIPWVVIITWISSRVKKMYPPESHTNEPSLITKTDRKMDLESASERDLPPLIYSKDKMSILVSLLIWGYLTVVPFVILVEHAGEVSTKIVDYLLLSLLTVIILVLLFETIFYVLPRNHYAKLSHDDSKHSTLGYRLISIIKFIKSAIVNEVHHIDEKEEMSIQGSQADLRALSRNGLPVDLDMLVQKEQRDKDTNGDGVFYIGGVETYEKKEEIMPNLEDFNVDNNIAPVQSITSNGQTDTFYKKFQESYLPPWKQSNPRLDKGKQTLIGGLLCILLSICFLFAGIGTQDPYYLKLSFVIPGALFIFFTTLVVIKRQFRSHVWSIGLVMAVVAYITTTLMLYDVGHKMGWTTAFIPFMILEIYLGIICYCDL